MYVTATAYDTNEQKITEVGFEGFAEITPMTSFKRRCIDSCGWCLRDPLRASKSH
jgi:hypothetical protein